MTTLHHLLTLIEQSGGADREIDAEIMCALAAPSGAWVEQSPRNGAWCIYYGKDTRGRSRLWGPIVGWYRSEGWNVTESIDAALALVERKLPGAYWEVARGTGTQRTGPFWASVYTDAIGLDEVGEPFTHAASTPALALCAALIRALIGM